MEERLKEQISKAIEEFNKYKAPEAKAKLISLDENSFKIEFTGGFCKTCGFYDYFDDFLEELSKAGLKAKKGEVKEIADGGIVEFLVER